jgi:hypothetical protein
MTGCATVRKALKDFGVLLLQDQELPLVVGLFCSRRVNASWWSIPEANDIFRCLGSLDSETAVATRLIKRKVTYVHWRLWPALVTLGAAQQPWQMHGLPSESRQLLARITRGESPVATGATVRELQDRLLAVAHEVHTPSGKHEIRLEEWGAWAARMNVEPLSSSEEAQRVIEDASARIGASGAALPWHRRGSQPAKSDDTQRK